MSPAEMQRKVRQHDNDLRPIYDMLGSIAATQSRHGNRLDEIAGTLSSQAARLDNHDARFDAHDARFDAHDGRFDAIDARLDNHDARFDTLEDKIDSVLETLRDQSRSDG